MAADRSTRAWSWVIVLLALALVVVLAVGAWATWRPLSDHDAARLTARDIVASVADSPDTPVSRAALERQLSALGPEATPAQRAQLDGREEAAAITGEDPADPEHRRATDAPVDLPTAITRVSELATQQEDPRLAVTLAAIAASWSASHAVENPDAPGAMTDETGNAPRPDADAHERCTPELTAVATQLDRASYTAQSTAVRGHQEPLSEVLVEWQSRLQELNELPAVTALLECEPRPARGGYALPQDIAQDPYAAASDAARDLSEVTAGALLATAPEERPWLMDTLESAARAQAQLRPREAVPALVGETGLSDR